MARDRFSTDRIAPNYHRRALNWKDADGGDDLTAALPVSDFEDETFSMEEVTKSELWPDLVCFVGESIEYDRKMVSRM